MHSTASNLGRRTGPSLKKLFGVMAASLALFVVLAELASATTNNQPALSSIPAATTPTVAVAPEPVATPETPVVETFHTAVQPSSLSYGSSEIVKMFQGGINTDVLLTFVETSNYPYLLSSREILYLTKIGVPSEIVNAMIRRDHQVELAKAEARQQSAPPMPEASAQPVTAPVSYVQPVVVV